MKTLLKRVAYDLYSDSQNFWLERNGIMHGILIMPAARSAREFEVLPQQTKTSEEEKEQIKTPIEQLSEDQKEKPVSPQLGPEDEAYNALFAGS